MSANAANFLKDLSLSKKHPEYADEVQGALLASQHATRMHRAGKLTKSELEDLEAHLFQKTMEALPMELWDSMMADGSLDSLQALAGHDGTRDGGDVVDARNAIYRKIQADALDEAWLDQRISAEHYARESRNLGPSEDIDAKISDGDHDGAAVEMFASRHDVSTHEADLNAYLDRTYGENREGREVAKPPGEIVRDGRSEPEKIAEPERTAVQAELAEYLQRQPAEPPSATDKNGITDLDIRDAQDAAA